MLYVYMLVACRDFIVQMLNNFGQSLEHGNQYIYESMPRMLSLWMDYGSEVAESETKPKNEVTLQGMRAVLAHLNKVPTLLVFYFFLAQGLP